jgi:hypothetical protein
VKYFCKYLSIVFLQPPTPRTGTRIPAVSPHRLDGAGLAANHGRTWRALRSRSVTSHADLLIDPPATSCCSMRGIGRLAQQCEICWNVQRPRKTDRRAATLDFLNKQRDARLKNSSISFSRIVGAIFMAAREVRPPAAHTRARDTVGARPSANPVRLLGINPIAGRVPAPPSVRFLWGSLFQLRSRRSPFVSPRSLRARGRLIVR